MQLIIISSSASKYDLHFINSNKSLIGQNFESMANGQVYVRQNKRGKAEE